ncbi:DUF2752 domain-containing protein [Salinimicrobium gaetbulicola]|uniref:DUF2752 domain-containing protein n=1 Tax=Salinimicrobium gaetbulicola TaxID=999702 RepID=A0ABW3ICQ3_9FLAO
MNSTTKHIIKWIGLSSFLLALIVVYAVYDPSKNGFFPPCPFHSFTGLQCPGCGSQRAVHHLLNFDIISAVHQNALLVIAIPYVLLGLLFDWILKPSEKVLKWRKILFGKNAILFVFSLVIFFWIFRNIHNY